MINKLKYVCFVFLYLLLANNSYGLTITDNNVLKNILTCAGQRTIELGSQRICAQWVIDVGDNDAVKAKDTRGLKIRCAREIDATSGTSNASVDNIGLSSKYQTTHYDYGYRCRDGSVLSTDSCAVGYTTTARGCSDFNAWDRGHCNRCDSWCADSRNWYDECPGLHGSGSYRKCDSWCSDHRNWYCAIPKVDRSSTKIVTRTYYRHWISKCDNPIVKNLVVDNLYDPNLISN